MNKLVFLVPIIFSSCCIYKDEFECPPPIGVPCTSLTELEKMVVETENGPDLFIPNPGKDGCIFFTGKQAPACISGRRVWICQKKEGEHGINGHYISENTDLRKN